MDKNGGRGKIERDKLNDREREKEREMLSYFPSAEFSQRLTSLKKERVRVRGREREREEKVV